MRAAVSAFGFGGINAHVLLEGSGERPDRVGASYAPRGSQDRIALVGIGAHVGLWPNREAVLARLLDPSGVPPAPAANWLEHPQAFNSIVPFYRIPELLPS